VQGWLVGPRRSTPGKKYPMIVQVHGGPASAATPRYVAGGRGGNPLVRELSRAAISCSCRTRAAAMARAWPSRSANRRDFGGGDWRDILAGVDAAIKQAPIDGERLGLMGHSYGGFMTMWGVTHSQRFKAAVAGAGIANWISYYGQNGIDQWMVPFFGATMYDDPAVYRAASPIESIKAAKTPTLIYVGERDVECPAGAVDGVLARPEGDGRADHAGDLRRRGACDPQAGAPEGPAQATWSGSRSIRRAVTASYLTGGNVGWAGSPPTHQCVRHPTNDTAHRMCEVSSGLNGSRRPTRLPSFTSLHRRFAGAVSRVPAFFSGYSTTCT
jgi:dienelactone hydrolase